MYFLSFCASSQHGDTIRILNSNWNRGEEVRLFSTYSVVLPRNIKILQRLDGDMLSFHFRVGGSF